MSGAQYTEALAEGLLVRHFTAAQDPASAKGKGDLLLIHGLGESGLGFETLAESAGEHGWNVLVPDLPGYGKSPRRESPLGLEDCAEHLARWLTGRQNAEFPVVLGHSMGGVIGQILCERAETRGLVNVEGNISFDDCGFSRRIAELPAEGFRRDGFPALLESIYQAGAKDLPLRGYYASLRFCDPAQLHLHSVELVGVSQSEELAQRMADLELPAIYLLGSPRGTAEHSRALLEASGIAWRGIEDAGHWPFLDQPERFEAELWSFLDALD